MNQDNLQSEKIETISWEAREFDIYKRDAKWYVIVITILLLVIMYTIYVKYWMLTGVTVMVGVVLYLSGTLKPKLIKYIVNNTGISIGDKLFTYNSDLKIFWFSNVNRVIKLNLISTIKLMPVISIKVSSDKKDKIRNVLLKFLPESDNEGEDWIDKINRFIKV